MQRVLLDSTDSITTHPRSDRGDDFPIVGVPTASSSKVRAGTPAVAMPATLATTNVSELFSVTSTTNADAAEGAASMSLTDSINIVGGTQFVVALLTGEKIIVTARSSGTAVSTLYLQEPLPLAVASGATVTCIAIAYTLTAAQTAQRGQCLAIFQTTISGKAYQWTEPFRIVRRYFNYTLTPTLLTQYWPALLTMRNRQDTTYEELIRTTFRNRIRPLLAARNIEEDDIVDAGALEPLHALACLMQVVLPNPSIDPGVREDLNRRWANDVETTFARNDWWEAVQDSSISLKEPQERAARGPRLTR